MTPSISRIVQALEPSATLAMAAKARELRAAGQTIYDFSLGEPDFGTPAHICQAAFNAMQAGHTHYTVASGIPELKAAIVRQAETRHGLVWSKEQVVVSNGAKHSLRNVFGVLCDPGDEVVIPAPYWVSYAELVKLSGGVPVIVATAESNNFKITPDQLRAALSGRTKLFLLCSPSNPTGSMYSPAELGELADVCLAHNVFVVSDEIYEYLTYGKPSACFACVRPGLQERCVVVNGVSKTYAMTGWRIGWTLSPLHVARAMADLQSQETSNPSSISQHAALAALAGPQDCVAQMRDEFARRREFVLGRIGEIPGLRVGEIDGAFYAFINIKEHLGRSYAGVPVANSTQWCMELLRQHGVATVMGSAFGAEGYVRVSFATSLPVLQGGFERIEAFIRGK
jgi:aspartate aminotransferase